VSHNPVSKQEKQFQKWDARLLDFFDLSLSNAEEASLLPILNSLNSDTERYEEISLIAEGGEKRITRVYDHRLNRQIAMARSIHAKTPEEHEQFLREAQLEANLAHPNITPVHNIGFDSKGVPFFTMELIPGDNLETIIKKLREGDEAYKQRYPLDMLLSMYLKVCDAIAYAHSRKVLHLDIKPSNIRVGEFGEVFICDWGVAQVLFDQEATKPPLPGEPDGDVLNDMTLSGIIKGSLGFMAPEQTLAKSQKTIQTDVYALGALLYMLLTYEQPVQGKSGNETLEHTRQGKVVAPHVWRKSHPIPSSLAAVALKALALKPEDRYETATELHQEISRYLTGFPTTAERATPFTMLSLMIKRHNKIAFILLLFLFLLTGVIGTTLVVIDQKKTEAIIARKEALSAKERATRNLSLFLQKQQEAQELDHMLDTAIHYALWSQDLSQIDNLMRILEMGLNRSCSPAERDQLLEKKGQLLFVVQQFYWANHFFDMMSLPTKEFQEEKNLSRIYASKKPKGSKHLANPELIELIRKLQPHNKNATYLYLHHSPSIRSQTPEEYLPLAIAILNKLNRIDSPYALQLEKRTQGFHLNLTQSPYQILRLTEIGKSHINVLVPLNLYSLDISYMHPNMLNETAGLQLKELRMVGLALPAPRLILPAVKRMNVEKLFIDTEAYSSSFIKELREVVEVIDERVEIRYSP